MIIFDKYEKRGDYHWKEFNKNTAYRQNALFIKSWIEDGSVLDIGAGDGLITSLLNAKGIDSSKKAVELAKKRKVDVVYGSSDLLPFKDNSFFNVLLADVIEHIEYPSNSLKEILRVIKPSGCLYIVTPPHGGKMDKYHYKEYTPKELVDYIESFGFKLEDEVIVKPELKRMYAKFRI